MTSAHFSLLSAIRVNPSVKSSPWICPKEQNSSSSSWREIKENGAVSNNYILTIHNTQDKNYTFDIELVDDKDFKIKRFESFDLKAGEKTKKILILETTDDFKKLKENPSKISIEIFTKENEKIKVKRQIAFFYPKN